MSYVRFLIRRAAFAVASAYLVVTVTFTLVNLTLWQEMRNLLARARYGGAPPEEIERIRQGFMNTRNLDAPLHERYVGWLVNVTTFEWGYSFSYNEPVVQVLDGRVLTTLEYVVPGVLFAVVLGVLVGVFTALAKDGAFDLYVRSGAYLLLGVPAFMVIVYYSYLSGTGLATVGGIRIAAPALPAQVLAAVTVGSSLVAGQLRFSRTAALEQTGQAFVKMLRAKGAGRSLLARHVLRNAAIPIVSLSVSELLAVLVLDVYVIEDVLRIDGLAQASLRAIQQSDIPLLIWATMVIVFIGITGNFLQDVLYGYLDPRIRSE